MSKQTPPRKPAANGTATVESGMLSAVTTASPRLPAFMALHAVEGWGKTSFAAYAPDPLFLLTRGETGLWTLTHADLLPAVHHYPRPFDSWRDLRAAVRAAREERHEFRTVVLDVATEAARLCEEHTCQTECEGNWQRYDDFKKGEKVLVLPEWKAFLQDLDALRYQRGMAVILLCHTRAAAFRNPEGADYDRYRPKMPSEMWAATFERADVVLFGQFVTVADKERGQSKAKGKGGTSRVIYAERRAAFDAKNRHALPAVIPADGGAQAAWDRFAAAMKAGRAVAQQAPAADDDQGDEGAEE
jgi:hypothetical protein